jgi:hypothetical protein
MQFSRQPLLVGVPMKVVFSVGVPVRPGQSLLPLHVRTPQSYKAAHASAHVVHAPPLQSFGSAQAALPEELEELDDEEVDPLELVDPVELLEPVAAPVGQVHVP